jgi:hypothetical protein
MNRSALKCTRMNRARYQKRYHRRYRNLPADDGFRLSVESIERPACIAIMRSTCSTEVHPIGTRLTGGVRECSYVVVEVEAHTLLSRSNGVE